MSQSMDPRHLYTLPIVGECELSPDRASLAYVVTTLDEESNAYRGSIRVIPSAGGTPRQLTQATARDGAPRWSADGVALFFLSDRSGSTQLWRIDAGGGQPTAMPMVPGNASDFAVSPDGVHVAIVTTPTTRRDEVERRGWRRITRLRFRSDGPGYLDDLPQLWLLDLAAGSAKALTDGSGSIGAPAWDPQGATIVFTGEHDPEADSLSHTELWTAGAADGWRSHKLLRFGSAVDAPAWSPDGAHIAFCGGDEPCAAGGLHNVRLFVVGRNGSDPRCLTRESEMTCANFVLTDVGVSGGATSPAWVSGRDIAVLASHRGAARVWRIREGSPEVPLTPASMSVTSFAMLDADTIVYCASDPASPPELYVARGGDARRLTTETQSWSAKLPGAPTQFRVASAGVQIDAWHLQGIGPAPRPCVLQIHGGPHFAYGSGFVFEFIVLAAAGYDVVYCNPRGSQTYGEPFAAAIKGDWGRPAFDDCMAVLDRALESFAIDRERLGVAGGSYGGYLTAWTIAHSSRFAAAIAMRPATNLVSLWGTSEVGRMLAEDFGGRPADALPVYLRDSVLTHADKISTPLLIIHSENDYRTPTEQSEQLFSALRQRGATVEVMRVLRADHNLSRNGPPRQRVARLEAIIEWFDRFLRGRSPL
jgi:dipeptidyl aminopeptidase/acylaminoacyl peptidase